MRTSFAAIAAILADKGIKLSPVADSPLELMHSVNADGDKQFIGLDKNISALVAKEIANIKHVVIPTIKELEDAYEAKLDSLEIVKAINAYKVVRLRIPTIISEFISRDVITKNVVDSDIISTKMMNGAITSGDEVRTLLNMRVASLDAYIEELVIGMSDEELLDIWDRYFSVISDSNPEIERLGYNVLRTIKEVSIVFVLLHNLKDKNLLNINVTDEVYTRNLTNYYNKVVRSIANVEEVYAALETTKKLVSERQGKEIYVHDKLYQEFIKDNEPESILGMILIPDLKSPQFYMDDILLNKDKYMANWEKISERLLVTDSVSAIERKKYAYEFILGEFVRDLPEAIEKFTVADTDDILMAISEHIKECKPSELENPTNMLLKIMGEYITVNINIINFSKRMSEISIANPDMKDKTKASLATFHLVIDYMLAQVEATKIK